MWAVLRNGAYAKLFAAQIVALIGTGLLTVALGLLAFDIAGGDAGLILGTALTIKMVAYVAVAPVTSALTSRLPRRLVLVGSDAIRAVIALSLPFVTEAWQIYVLIFVLQAASATFTPTFQAVIPDVLPDERHYTQALSLSRLAYDLESLLSPVIAAALLTVIAYDDLFVGTAAGFLASAVLVMMTRLPPRAAVVATAFLQRLTLGVRTFWKVRELRTLSSLNMVVAASTAMVIVNTVVLVQGELGRPESDVALLLAAYGAGSMIVALSAPRLLDRVEDLRVMGTGAVTLPIALAAAAVVIAVPAGIATWWAVLIVWAVLGAATSAILTPTSRLLRRGSDDSNRPAVFAAQFSLSHACFIVTYPAAGVLGALIGLPATAAVLAVIGAAAALVSVRGSVKLLRSRGEASDSPRG